MPKDKEVTIYDIAKKLKISPATVSRGLQDHPGISKKTKKKIFELADQIGYRSNHFARNLRSKKSNTIGVIIPRLNSHFMSSAISGMEQVANSQGYNLIISQSSESTAKEAINAHTMFHNRVDGLLVSLAYDTLDLTHFEPFLKKNIPILFFDRVKAQEHCTTILIDNRKAAFEATSHLIEQGCRRIVHVTAPLMQNVYQDRFKGYKQALAEHGIPYHEDDLIIGNLSLEAGIDAANLILERTQLPDGIFVANDTCAVGCMLALKKKGMRIPEDFAIAGFNNDPVSMVIEPNLSTINYSGFEMGEVAARHLINHLTGLAPMHNTDQIILRSEFIVRSSSLKKKS
jgi:LacI family transcriptional regulator